MGKRYRSSGGSSERKSGGGPGSRISWRPSSAREERRSRLQERAGGPWLCVRGQESQG